MARFREAPVKPKLPCGACPRYKLAAHGSRRMESAAGFDGAGHCIREQDESALWFYGNE